MAAPTPANMENCDPKCKCLSGPYANEAYSCDTPCTGQGDNCTFDCQNGCDCPLEANFIGAWGYDDKNNRRTASNLVVDIAPYYDGLGRLVTYTAGVSELPCDSPAAFVTLPCGQVPQYSGAVQITKTASCFGNGTVGNQYVFAYLDGVLDDLTFMNVAVGLSCQNTIGDFNSGSVGWFYGDTIQEVQDQLDAWSAGSGPPSP